MDDMKITEIKDIDFSNCKTAVQVTTKVCCLNNFIRCLEWRAECRNLEDLKECIKIIDSYNDFEAESICEALDKYASLKRFYNEDNPNNKEDFFTFEIGREGSPVIYIKFMRRMQIFKDGKLIPSEARTMTKEDFEMRMRALAEIARPQELHFSEDGLYHVCRMWWD